MRIQQLFLQMLGTFPVDPASLREQGETRDRQLPHACHLWPAFATRVRFDLAAFVAAPAGFAIFGNKAMEKPLGSVGCRVGMSRIQHRVRKRSSLCKRGVKKINKNMQEHKEDFSSSPQSPDLGHFFAPAPEGLLHNLT